MYVYIYCALVGTIRDSAVKMHGATVKIIRFSKSFLFQLVHYIYIYVKTLKLLL